MGDTSNYTMGDLAQIYVGLGPRMAGEVHGQMMMNLTKI